METILLEAHQIEEAAALLKRGEPIAIPTETVYGLAANIFCPETIQKIFTIKNRPADNPLIAHVASFGMAETVAFGSLIFERLAQRFWPGPLTFVLPKKEIVPAIAAAGLSTLAVRMPAHATALRLIETVGFPLVAPSANLSGKPSPTCAAHVLEDLRGKIAAVLDGGPCEFGIESTVLSLVGERPVILRPGAISQREIEEVLKQSIDIAGAGAALQAPGMKYRHYAPQASIHLVQALPTHLDNSSFILSREPTGISLYRPLSAKTLYAFLREADKVKANEIWVLVDPLSAADAALMNRLVKASGSSELTH